MKQIQILGTGCPKCEKLAALADQAAQALGQPYRLTKIKDIKQFAAFGVMMPPAVVVDGRVVVSGRLPSLEELKKLLA